MVPYALAVILASAPAAAQTPRVAPDTLAIVQPNAAFTSLEDGQPGALGRWSFQVNLGRQDFTSAVSPTESFVELEYTGTSTWLMRNLEFQVVIPIRLRRSTTKLGRPIFGWQQRWIADFDAMFSVATLMEYELPTQGEAGEVAAALTGILTKGIGTGSVYLNVLGGTDRRPAFALGGARLGYILWPNQRVSFVADYELLQLRGRPPAHVLELGMAWVPSSRLSIGPGIVLGLTRNSETPRFGSGVRVIWVL